MKWLETKSLNTSWNARLNSWPSQKDSPVYRVFGETSTYDGGEGQSGIIDRISEKKIKIQDTEIKSAKKTSDVILWYAYGVEAIWNATRPFQLLNCHVTIVENKNILRKSSKSEKCSWYIFNLMFKLMLQIGRLTLKSRLFGYCLFVWSLSSHSKIFHSYGKVTIAGEGLQILTYARNLWPLSSKDYLTRHTYCDTGLPFTMYIFEDPWHSQMLPSVWQWSCHYLFLRLGSVATVILCKESAEHRSLIVEKPHINMNYDRK